MQFRFPILLPVVPMMGDPVEIDGDTVAAAGEFSRLQRGMELFAVESADGMVYEVEALERGDARRGTQRWKAIRRIEKADFQKLPRSDVR